LTTRTLALLFAASTLVACPAVPSVDGRPPVPDPVGFPDTTATPDASGPAPTPVGFGSCETAVDCATYPNSASLCDHLECALQCIPGFANCDRETENGCEQSLSTPVHCGGCSQPCAPFQGFGTCAGGLCTVAACNLGFGNCDLDPANGCETLLVTPTDCGDCGVPCLVDHAEPTCDAGECGVDTCHPGFGDCDGESTNGCELSVDTRLRCGACDAACQPGQGCAPGPHPDEGELPAAHHCYPVAADPIPLPAAALGVATGPDAAMAVVLTATEPATWADADLALGGDADAVLLHLIDGEPGWSRTIGGLNADAAVAVTIDASGHVAFTGAYRSGAKLGGALLPHTGGTDVFLVSYDAAGEQRWGLGLGGPGDDAPTAMAADDDGALVIVGVAAPPASFGGDVLTGAGPLGFVARYATTGTSDWTRTVESDGPVTLVDVALDGAGAAVVLATAAGPLRVDGVEVASSGPALLIWTVDGAFVGAQAVPLTDAVALALTSDGAPLVAGDDLVVWLTDDAPTSLDVPGVVDLATGPADDLLVTGITSGAFDVGLGPVIVDGAFAARHDATTGEAAWFVALDDTSARPLAVLTVQGAAVVGAQIAPLHD
jgi:hypothetical protein